MFLKLLCDTFEDLWTNVGLEWLYIFLKFSPKRIQRRMDPNRRRSPLLCLEEVTTESRQAGRRRTRRQQVSPLQAWCTHARREGCSFWWLCGSAEDVEQDTVLQLQEVIEQLRNVFPSEPGEHLLALQISFSEALPLWWPSGRVIDGGES